MPLALFVRALQYSDGEGPCPTCCLLPLVIWSFFAYFTGGTPIVHRMALPTSYQAGSLEATETIPGENGTPRVLLAPELALAVLSYFCRFSQNISESHMFCDIHAGTIWSFAH